ncbi:MAG: hypothetical protein K2X62_00565, partial [Beijerinckiaceae bacterium]|nr:hypothetical protein [Beijerinckiaceae bacterium]
RRSQDGGKEKEPEASSANRSVDHARTLLEAAGGVICPRGRAGSLHGKTGFLRIATDALWKARTEAAKEASVNISPH